MLRRFTALLARGYVVSVTRRRVVVAMAVLATGVLGVASSALAGETAKARYIAKADAICSSEGKLLKPYLDKYTQLISGEKVNDPSAALILSQADAVRSASLSKLKALPVPAGERARLANIWGTFDRLITQTEQVAIALGGGEIASMADLDADAEMTGGRYEQLAQAFGFKVCGAGRG